MLNITFAPNDRRFFNMKVSKAILSNGRLGEDSDALLQRALITLMKDTESIWEIKCCCKTVRPAPLVDMRVCLNFMEATWES